MTQFSISGISTDSISMSQKDGNWNAEKYIMKKTVCIFKVKN